MSKILIVDDEPKSVRLLRVQLEHLGHAICQAYSFDDAMAKLDRELFDLLITDVRLPDGSGIELTRKARKRQPPIPVIVVTAYGRISDAVEVMRLGATEYVQKPFELEALATLVERLLESERIRGEHSYLVDEMLEGEQQVELVGRSPAMQRVRELVKKVAATRSNVLLQGESGTGKELVAKAIHTSSTSRAQPLVKVNCPGIPAQLFEAELFGHIKGAFTGAHESRKGKFELAGRGNILLDEIAEIPFELQAKLLQVLDSRCFTRVGGMSEIHVKARIIAATNRDIKALVDTGRFREDLFYRLNVFPIQLPAVRYRKEDIPDTALHLLRHVGANCGLITDGIGDDAMAALVTYNWPGNVRELRNVLERALVLAEGGRIELDHLPLEIQENNFCPDPKVGTFHARVQECKHRLLLGALEDTCWVKKDAAAQLGLSQRAFSHYVAKYKLDSHRRASKPPNGSVH